MAADKNLTGGVICNIFVVVKGQACDCFERLREAYVMKRTVVIVCLMFIIDSLVKIHTIVLPESQN